ncbi:MAG: hypothetical protein EKK48_30010 [Candidatus Melainabacteria bacterium]|nr:MAG: hypothetical protein EKK48_30010 [Candidatus Melainabacteria bacterium]
MPTPSPQNRRNKYTYDSMNYHRRAIIPNKTLWHKDVSLEAEFGIFQKAESNSWYCSNGYLWSFGDDIEGKHVLGTNKERLACFQKPSNSADPWHGFPIKSRAAMPPSDVTDKWVNRIARSFYHKIVKERI